MLDGRRHTPSSDRRDRGGLARNDDSVDVRRQTCAGGRLPATPTAGMTPDPTPRAAALHDEQQRQGPEHASVEPTPHVAVLERRSVLRVGDHHAMPSDHPGLGPFLSQVRSRAEECDAEALRALLLAHAETLEPAARAPFCRSSPPRPRRRGRPTIARCLTTSPRLSGASVAGSTSTAGVGMTICMTSATGAMSHG
jgi:hypothetical protein